MEKEKPEVYKEAMEHILKELASSKWKSNLPASRKREFSPVNVEKRETAIERLCMETASMAVFYTQDAWSYSYFISNYKSSFLLKNYFSCDR